MMTTVRRYFSTRELAERGPYTEDAIRRMVSRGTLRRGVHWFQPGGRKGRIVFDIEAIDAFIRKAPDTAPRLSTPPTVVRLANGRELNLADDDRP